MTTVSTIKSSLSGKLFVFLLLGAGICLNGGDGLVSIKVSVMMIMLKRRKKTRSRTELESNSTES